MSNFTYEIDERNLRLKMKEFTVPVNEEAWQKFETFSESTGNQQRDTRLKNFNFNLNRSVVLPSVFGVIIILFSFLLVNFVSIKNPAKISEQKAEVKPAETVVPTPAPVIKTEKVQKVATAEIKANPQVAATPAKEIKAEEKVVVTTPEVKPEAIVASENTIDSAASLSVEEEKAKRRAERRAKAAEKQKLQEISPTPISDEGDSEVRPD